MPEWIKKLREAQAGEVDPEYLAFLQWMESTKGDIRARQFTRQNYRDSIEYRQWLGQNKPFLTRPFVKEKPSPWLAEPISPLPQAPPPVSPEQAELERQAAQMGISVSDLLRSQMGIPTSWELEHQQAQQQGETQRDWQNFIQTQVFPWRQQRAEMAQRALGAQLRGGTIPSDRDIERQQQEESSRQWETWRNRMLGTMGGERDWIRRFELQNQRNPFAVQEPSMAEEVARYELELEVLKKEKSQLMSEMPMGEFNFADIAENPKLASTYGALVRTQRGIDAKTNWIKQGQASREYQEEMEMARGRPTAAGGWEFGGGMPEEPPRPTTPLTPAWLKRLEPTMPERIEKRPLAPLSGQFLTGMSPTERQQWMGFTEWAGQSPEDLLFETERMLPRTPRIPGRWAPARA